MGGSSGFSSKVKPLIAPFQSVNGDTLLVDVSYIFHRIPLDLKFRLFVLEPTVTNQGSDKPIIKKVSEFIAQEILGFTANLEKTLVIFEDRSSNKSVRRTHRGHKSKSSNLNKAIRETFLSRSIKSNFHGRKKIARLMGRPPIWISILIMEHLRELGFKCIHAPSGVQADQVIFQLAKTFQSTSTVSVLGNDRDYIAFSEPNVIQRIIYTQRGKLVQLTWEDVATNLQLKRSDLIAYAYAFGGCDDITENLFRFGWTSAYKIAKNSASLDDFFDLIQARFQNSDTNLPKLQKIKNELDHLIQGKFIVNAWC
jgi:hypothetical protein